MEIIQNEAKITSFLVKVASRCNLNCDYCYVYHHADQSWRSMPPILSMENQTAFIERLSEYVTYANLSRCVIVFHGGEPLLMGGESLVFFANQIRKKLGDRVKVDFCLQTNGLLLKQKILDTLKKSDIGISLSLDGPKDVNDLHRNSRKGRSSFNGALEALRLLKTVPSVFAGVISVIDPRVKPRQLLEFFNEYDVPKLDFLLPDAHHFQLPPGRLEKADIYEKWLIEAFDLWFDEFSHLPVRTFEALLDSVAGLPSQTDAFGFGDVSLITIETDGSYHDLDVLKVVGEGATKIGGTVRDTPISFVVQSAALKAHRQLLQKTGLSERCQQCEVVDICGAGAVPHRYGPSGFENPTIYCREMLALIKHIRSRLVASFPDTKAISNISKVPSEIDLKNFERAEHSSASVDILWNSAVNSHFSEIKKTLSLYHSNFSSEFSNIAKKLIESPNLNMFAEQPGVIAWARSMCALLNGRVIHAVDGTALMQDADYMNWLLENKQVLLNQQLKVHQNDRWLRIPFGKSIEFEHDDVAKEAIPVFNDALKVIADWRPDLSKELMLVCKAVQFIRDPAADPSKIVSFSDNAVPGALFVSVLQCGQLIDEYDLADSLIHEYRHQKLYLLERQYPVVERTSLKVVSPWREELRPPSGLFHAVFVFVELRRFWKHIQANGPERLKVRAEAQIIDTDGRLKEAFETLKHCPLTEIGKILLSILQESTID